MSSRHYLLFPLVMPGIGDNEEAYQYIKQYEINDVYEYTTEDLIVYNFDTWFNLFPVSLYKRYCDLGDLYFHARVEGEYRIKIFGSKRVEEFKYRPQLLLTKYCRGNLCCNMPDSIDNCEALFIELFFKKDNHIKIKSLSWHTGKKPALKTRLHLFNINDEIKIVNPVPKYSYLSRRIKEFSPSPVSGQEEREDRLFPVKALAECLEKCPKTPGVADRLIIPAQPVNIAFITLARLSLLPGYLKDVYRNIFIYGEYLNPLNNILFKRVITLNNPAFKNPFFRYNLHDTDGILNIIDENKKFVQNHELRYCPEFAWICLSAATLRARGLPLAMDFKSSIYEYVCRAGTPRFLTINGFNPVSGAVIPDFYTNRDYEARLKTLFLLNIIYNNSLDEFLANLTRRKNLLHLTWNYPAMERLIQTLREIIAGDFDSILRISESPIIDRAKPISDDDIQKALGRPPQPPEKNDGSRNTVFVDKDIPESYFYRKEVDIIYPILNIKVTRVFDEERGKKLSQEFKEAVGDLKDNMETLRSQLSEYYAGILASRARGA